MYLVQFTYSFLKDRLN